MLNITAPSLTALIDRAVAEYRANHVPQAAELCKKILATHPDHAEALWLLGLIAHNAKQNPLAESLLRRSYAIDPHLLDTLNTLGNVLLATDRPREAAEFYKKALALRPNTIPLIQNVACACRDMGELDEALKFHRQAAALDPTSAEAKVRIAFIELMQGHLENAWPGYEERLRFEPYAALLPKFSQPQWRGEDPQGKTILVHSEQGFGDTLHFIRYAPLLAQRGANVILHCQPEMKRLLELSFPTLQHSSKNDPQPPAFNLYCPMLSLPFAFKTTLANLPAEVPYLHADPADVAKWKKKLDTTGPGLKVGLVWAGSATDLEDHKRSLPLAALAPLAKVPNVQFFSLQKGEAAKQAQSPPEGMALLDLTADLHDFAVTAALIENLDLIISVDTAAMHLAAALGKPTWLLLPFVSDWRWMLHREDSPWYPTLRIFRQPSPGEWSTTIQRVAAALSDRASSTPA